MNKIAYQNKDITSKIFAEKFKGKSLRVYGIDIPEVVQVLPTNLPDISANELRIDNIFLLKDGTVAIIDYESTYKEENKLKYINYIERIVSYYKKEWKYNIQMRMIVIYTADITREETSNLFDVGCLRLEVESAYLAELNSEDISKRLHEKVQLKQKLTDEEMMEFIILPLTYIGLEEKNKSIRSAIQLAEQILDEETKTFVLSGIAVFADKVISKENADIIRRLLVMTKVGQLFEEEKIAYAREQAIKFAEALLKDDMKVELVAKYTNLSIEEVEEVQKRLFAMVE